MGRGRGDNRSGGVAAAAAAGFTWEPLTQIRWGDFETLFGPKGACAGCWCMWWRIPRSQFNEQKGDGNRDAMRKLVDSGEVPGIIGYIDGKPAAWCSVAPRESFPGLDRSRTLKRIDTTKVWSVVCLFVSRAYRRRGLSIMMLNAAADYVRSQGGRMLEGYPSVPKTSSAPDVFLFTGVPAAFEHAGFTEAARPSPARRIMRRPL